MPLPSDRGRGRIPRDLPRSKRKRARTSFASVPSEQGMTASSPHARTRCRTPAGTPRTAPRTSQSGTRRRQRRAHAAFPTGHGGPTGLRAPAGRGRRPTRGPGGWGCWWPPGPALGPTWRPVRAPAPPAERRRGSPVAAVETRCPKTPRGPPARLHLGGSVCAEAPAPPHGPARSGAAGERRTRRGLRRAQRRPGLRPRLRCAALPCPARRPTPSGGTG